MCNSVCGAILSKVLTLTRNTGKMLRHNHHFHLTCFVDLLGIIIKNNNWFALCYEDKSISQRYCDTVVKLDGNAVVIICFLLK